MNQPEMKRPRSPKDYPTLDSWFTPAFDTFAQGGENLLHLMRSLIGTTRYIEYWRQDRSYEENQAAAGVDPLADPKAYLEFQKNLGNKSDRLFNIGAYAFSNKIFPNDPTKESLSLHYSGGTENQGANTLSVIPSITNGQTNLTLEEWLRVIGTIIDWRQPRYIAVGSGNYGIHDRVFEHRAWNGWLGWFPVWIDRQGLPSYALTFDVGPGTLVATQETNVITNDPAQRERAKEVEIALAQMGVLPTNAYLVGHEQ